VAATATNIEVEVLVRPDEAEIVEDKSSFAREA
jgi:hypothetical protein